MLDSGMGPEEMVNSEFEELYPGKVQNTQIAYDAKALTKHHNDFVKTKGKLETVLDKYQMKMERHKKLKKRETVNLLLVSCISNSSGCGAVAPLLCTPKSCV